jgi:diketogulonate reductase-like aldo/keto reductase
MSNGSSDHDRPRPHMATGPHRRDVLIAATTAAFVPAAMTALAPVPIHAATPAATTPPDLRRIPSTGRSLPAVGLGTWITFNVGNSPRLRARSVDVVRAFVAEGGGLIDSSPMYGSAQAVVGQALAELGRPVTVFSADKVWTSRGADGPPQIEETARRWGVATFDLLQVHNLDGWETHLPLLFAMKAAGRVGHVGITTSHGRRHDLVADIMRRQPIDFVQLTYNAVDREVENRLLPLAQERGIAVIVNRPFQGGSLVQRLAGTPLPGYAGELGAQTWSELLLKHILAHPAVTCVIPATTNVEHVRLNKRAARGPMPDVALRRRLADDVAAA